MPGRLVILSTSHRVAPGLLTAGAWDELRAADLVAAPDDHPQVPYLAEAGVTSSVVPAEVRRTAGELAGWLLARAADRTVVWVAGTASDDDLAAELARRLVDQDLEIEVEVVPGSYDLPGGRLLDLVAVMDRLRAECPWDREQTHATLAKYLIEEAYETVDTIESGDTTSLREELGEVLLHVMFHSRVASERTVGTGFTVDDVAAGIVEKMVRRHPHVFSDAAAEDIPATWHEIKAAERAAKNNGAPSSALDGVPLGQPALQLAAALQRRAVRAGLPADLVASPGDTLGARLFNLIAAAPDHPETALRAEARAFRTHFQHVESTTPTTPEEWRQAWNAS